MTGSSPTQSRISKLDKVVNHFVIYAPADMDPDKLSEFNQMFSKAGNSEYVREPFMVDGSQFVAYNLSQTKKWFDAEKLFWEQFIGEQK